jgi:hypothetical protein
MGIMGVIVSFLWKAVKAKNRTEKDIKSLNGILFIKLNCGISLFKKSIGTFI